MFALERFEQRLAAGDVIVMDGGMGPELARRGVPMHKIAWAAPAVLDHYDVVRETHEDYIGAGAEVIITNTFMASFNALEHAGFADRFLEINRRSVEAAVEARANVGDASVVIAGALFPGYPGDAAEVPDATIDEDAVLGHLREQIGVMKDAGVDVFVLEMIQTTQWGRLATQAVAEVGVPLLLSPAYGRLVVQDAPDYLFPFDPPGQPGEQVRQIVEGADGARILAVNLMHTELEDVDVALGWLADNWDGALGVYPHHGEHSEEAPGFHPLHVDPADYTEMSRRWVAQGVQIVGGCCGIGPEHIRALKGQLPEKVPAGARPDGVA